MKEITDSIKQQIHVLPVLNPMQGFLSYSHMQHPHHHPGYMTPSVSPGLPFPAGGVYHSSVNNNAAGSNATGTVSATDAALKELLIQTLNKTT